MRIELSVSHSIIESDESRLWTQANEGQDPPSHSRSRLIVAEAPFRNKDLHAIPGNGNRHLSTIDATGHRADDGVSECRQEGTPRRQTQPRC